MHGLCRRCRPEQPGGLGESIFVSLFGKGKIFSIGLGFSCKGLLQIFCCGTHDILLVDERLI
jgi:hypothetical protein